MTELNTKDDPENEVETFPIEPRYHPIHKIPRKIFDRLASTKLAMLLLITILLCCLAGVTIYRGDRATEMVFGTLWFNGLLILLVINTACCFFGRMWGRRITVISFGMILFHLSFVAMFLAIVANSLFYFEGSLRLTEGETLSNSDPISYDVSRHGLLFSYSRLKGETTLLRVHRGFKVDGNDKQIAFDVSVTEGGGKKNATIYINNKFDYKGVEYFRDREGYSLLVILNDRQGRELFGAHFPLQSFKQKDGAFIYSTGTMDGPGLIDFPPEKGKVYFSLQLDYLVDKLVDRSGNVRFQVWPAVQADAGHSMDSKGNGSPHGMGNVHKADSPDVNAMMTGGAQSMNSAVHGPAGSPGGKAAMKQLADGTVRIGEKFAFGEYELSAPEVRYWVAMNTTWNPGKPFVLASLCVGLAGIIITTFGRMMRGRK